MSVGSSDIGAPLRDGLNFLRDDSPSVTLFDKATDFSRNGSTKTSSPIDFTPGARDKIVADRVLTTSPDTSHLSERQAMWDKQAQSADAKQAELFHIQWNLIREQMSTFSRESIQIRSELQTLKEEVVSAFEKERDAREHGDLALRPLCDDLKKALEAEVNHRMANQKEVEKNFSLLRSNLETQSRQEAALEKTVMDLNEELRRMQASIRGDLETESTNRQTSDERILGELQQANAAMNRSLEAGVQKLESGLEALRDALRREAMERQAEIEKRSAHSTEEVSKYIREVRGMLEQESKTRAGDRALLEEELGRLRAEIVAEARTRKESISQANMDMHEALKSLSDLLTKEAQERIACDEQVSRAALQAKQTIEKEIHDRSTAQSELATRLKELSTSLEEERRERETHDRNQIAESRKELEAEKAERRDEISALKQAVRAVESSIASGLKTLRAAFEAEEAERKDEHRNTTQNITSLKNQQEADAREVTRISGELSDRLRALSDAIGIEATERQACDAEVEKGLRELSAAFDREARQWSQAFKGIQDMIKTESVDREAGDEAGAKSLKAAVQRMETLTERVREALWVKMLALADRFFEYSREWRDTPPTLDFSSQVSSQVLNGNMPALRDGRPNFPKLE